MELEAQTCAITIRYRCCEAGVEDENAHQQSYQGLPNCEKVWLILFEYYDVTLNPNTEICL
jgi:hypothetical protein